jgi:hypothetical protein
LRKFIRILASSVLLLLFASPSSKPAIAQTVAQYGSITWFNDTSNAIWVTLYFEMGHGAKGFWGCVLPGKTINYRPQTGASRIKTFWTRMEVKASTTSCSDHSNIADQTSGGYPNAYIHLRYRGGHYSATP